MTLALCPSLEGPWVAAEGFRRVKTEAAAHSSIWWLPSVAATEQPCRALLWEQGLHRVFFCVQCKIWWKRASFLLLLLGLCQHHLSWPTSISLSFPSALTRISSPITCDSCKCSTQPWCRLAGFCSQRGSAPLNLKLALPCSLQLLL